MGSGTESSGEGEARLVFWTDTLIEWGDWPVVYYVSVLLLALITITANILGDHARVQWGNVFICVALLPALAEVLTPIRFPWLLKWLIALTLIMHMAGGLFGFYVTLYPVYDKICHFVASSTISFIIFELILVFSIVSGLKPKRRIMMATIFLTVILLGLSWEYAEYTIDALTGSNYFVSFTDSFCDMVFNIVGIGFVLFWVSRYMRREPFDRVTRRFVSFHGNDQ